MNINLESKLVQKHQILDMANQNNGMKTYSEEDFEAARKLSEDFEAIFLEIVIKSMRDSVQKSGLMGNSNGEQIFQSMLDGEYSKALASQRSTGLASSIEEFMLRAMNLDAEKIKSIMGRSAYGCQGLQDYRKRGKMEAGAPRKEPLKIGI
ncbi:MAG: rod-binding protein [Oligoflexales bacterium]|nr:rod-binding protein [Oligoflexales bacterium]